MDLKLLPINSFVKFLELDPEPIIGRVVGIEIYGNFDIRYQIVWWEGRNRKMEWIHSFELEPYVFGKTLDVGWIHPV